MVQVDEPVMVRFPDQALEYGIEQLSSCFDGVSAPDVVKTVHLCCGYPDYLVSEIFPLSGRTYIILFLYHFSRVSILGRERACNQY